MTKSAKFILAVALFLVAAVGNIFLSTWLHLTLKQEFTGGDQLGIGNCLTSLIRDQNHRLLYGLILLVAFAACIALFLMEKNKENFNSDTVQITDTIRTPVAIGQGQHGTAKWLEKKQYAHVFHAVETAPDNEQVVGLIEQGYCDLPKELGGIKIEKTNENSPKENLPQHPIENPAKNPDVSKQK